MAKPKATKEWKKTMVQMGFRESPDDDSYFRNWFNHQGLMFQLAVPEGTLLDAIVHRVALTAFEAGERSKEAEIQRVLGIGEKNHG